MVDVKVTSRTDGKPVTGLLPQDFAIYEDGKQQQIALFSQNEVPLSLALVIDTSGSTQNEVGLMRKAARRFLDELKPKDRIGIIGFSQDIELLADLTSDRGRLEMALENLRAGSGTALYDTLVLTVEDLLKKVDGRKAAVIMTDGVDSIGQFTYPRALNVLERSLASFYFLELDTRAFTEPRLLLDCADDRHFKLSRKQLTKYGERFDKDSLWWVRQEYCTLAKEQRGQVTRRLYELAHEELAEMATRTGGRVYPVQGLKELSGVYSRIAGELRIQYSVGYYPTNEKRDGRWRSLQVEVKGGGHVAQTKPGYRAPLN